MDVLIEAGPRIQAGVHTGTSTIILLPLANKMTAANFTILVFTTAQSAYLMEQMPATCPYGRTACQRFSNDNRTTLSISKCQQQSGESEIRRAPHSAGQRAISGPECTLQDFLFPTHMNVGKHG